MTMDTKTTEWEKETKEFAEEIGVLRPDGSVDMAQLEKELYDYRFLISNTSKVFDHVTGGMASKPNTMAFEIIALADDLFNETFERDIKEETEDALHQSRTELMRKCLERVGAALKPFTKEEIARFEPSSIEATQMRHANILHDEVRSALIKLAEEEKLEL